MGLMPFHSVLLKIERAKKHIAELEAERDSFFGFNPYTFDSKLDPQTGKRQFYCKRVSPVPDLFSLIVGDVLNNLRSALDHMAYRFVRLGNAPTGDNLRNAYFPIGENVTDYRSRR